MGDTDMEPNLYHNQDTEAVKNKNNMQHKRKRKKKKPGRQNYCEQNRSEKRERMNQKRRKIMRKIV